MIHRKRFFLSGVIAAFAALLYLPGAVAADIDSKADELRIFGNTSTIELAPVLVAADGLYKGKIVISNGGILNLVRGEADAATNAETQLLRQSIDNPNLRIIFTVSEGFYRLVARRSAGISKVADLRGKKIATVPSTSSAYYLHKLLVTANLTEADVTIVRIFPLNLMPPALKNRDVDAVTIWEPEIQNAKDAIGDDAIEFQDRKLYRELFNLQTTAEALNDPKRRAALVDFLRSLIAASKHIESHPQEAWPLISSATKIDQSLISKVWHHMGYPGTLVPDVLEVMTEEEVWVAKEKNRTPRSRMELAKLIDDSVLNEALGKLRPKR